MHVMPSPARRRGTLLLADISGYTSFLDGVAVAHRDLIVEAEEPPPAYAVLSHLLSGMVDSISPAFQVAKLEGDAVFAVADEPVSADFDVLACIRRCHEAFRDGLATAAAQWICNCDACARVGELDLKFVLHHGTYVAQPIAGHLELLGADVNLVHRLLKNRAREILGRVAYVLMTQTAVDTLAIPHEGTVAADELSDGGAPVHVRLLPLTAGSA